MGGKMFDIINPEIVHFVDFRLGSFVVSSLFSSYSGEQSATYSIFTPPFLSCFLDID